MQSLYRMTALALLAAMAFVPAQAVSFGVGIGFGKGGGWGGSVYTEFPDNASRAIEKSKLPKAALKVFLNAGLVPEEIGVSGYRLTYDGSAAEAKAKILAALAKEGFAAGVLQTKAKHYSFSTVYYSDADAQVVTEIEKKPELALVVPSRLVVYTEKDKTYILFEDMNRAAKDMRKYEMDAAEDMQVRLAKVLVRVFRGDDFLVKQKAEKESVTE